MNADELKAEIEMKKAEMQLYMREISALDQQYRKARSREWIKANGVRETDIERSKGEGLPYFWNVYEFGRWLEEHSKKPWAEWNDRIYATAELINGRMAIDAPGDVNDVVA